MSATERVAFDAEFVDAGLGHVLRVGFELGGCGGKLASPVASLIEQQAAVFKSSSISVRRARSCSVSNCRRPSRASAALRSASRIGGGLCQLLVFGSRCSFSAAARFDLRSEGVYALSHLGEQRLDALQDRRRRSGGAPPAWPHGRHAERRSGPIPHGAGAVAVKDSCAGGDLSVRAECAAVPALRSRTGGRRECLPARLARRPGAEVRVEIRSGVR